MTVTVGATVGVEEVGSKVNGVGSTVVGARVGNALGSDVVGLAVGAGVGSELDGVKVGAGLGSEVGIGVGASVTMKKGLQNAE